MAAVVMVVAYQAAWTPGIKATCWWCGWLLRAVAFTVLAVFVGAARTPSVSIIGGLDNWSRAVANARRRASVGPLSEPTPA
jgi:hypothetical protein